MTTKKWLLFVSWLAISFGLLWFITSLVLAEDSAQKTLKMDLKNAVHHIEKVKLIDSHDGSGEIRSIPEGANYKLVWIRTKNFVISKEGWDEENKIERGSNSNILWWVKNKVVWNYSSILWWSGNINSWNYSTILWWEGNKIKFRSNYSTILWWENNWLHGTWSVVVWWKNNSIVGDYSVTVWINNTVNGNYSAALWVDSKVSANNSFLWTDSNHNDVLSADNVFAVVSSGWMVVNANAPHVFAQLTIWGPLVIGESTNDVVACTSNNAWVMKVVEGEDNRKCLCGCDGVNWHSLYGQWTCEKKCNVNLEPSCGDKVYRCEKSGKKYFVWTCGAGAVPVWWMWAYVVTKDNYVHRSCQSDDWTVASCSAVSSISWNGTSYCS